MIVEHSTSRRRFLRGVAATAALPLGSLAACGDASSAPAGPRAFWLSAQGDQPETFGLVATAAPHDRHSQLLTGFRGHDVAQHPVRTAEAILFGRRPGTTSAAIDVLHDRVLASFEAGPGRAFQGHGFFTPDGVTLVTSEADLETGVGWLGIRDGDTYELLDSIETFGVGPHEIQLLADGTTAVVANGGLLTRPETGRQVLNLDTMDSTLVYLDLQSGSLLSAHRVDVPKASIRHLDLTDGGEVALGLQVQRDAVPHDDVLPLTGVHRPGEDIVLFDQGMDRVALMNDYVGSVAVSSDARVAGFTSPRGDVANFWDLDTGAYLGLHELVDCSGIAESTDREHFIISSSLGEVRTIRASDLQEARDSRKRFDGVRWDNHLAAVVVEEQ